MSVTEIVLLVIGGLFFAISFFLPDGKKKEEERVTEEEIRKLIDREMQDAKTRIDDMVEETVTYSVEKTERALERLSTEKIMAVDEYSETVLKKINDNHNEAVFLYDMLNDKDEKLKSAGEEIKASQSELEKQKKELEEKQKLEAAKKEAEEKARLEAEEKAKLEKEQKEKEAEAEKSSFVPFKPQRVVLPSAYTEDVAVKPEEVIAKKKPASIKTASRKTEEVEVHFEPDNDGRKNSNEMIRKLHNEGKSNMQIAKELGLGVGEVKLVIDLFASKKSK